MKSILLLRSFSILSMKQKSFQQQLDLNSPANRAKRRTKGSVQIAGLLNEPV